MTRTTTENGRRLTPALGAGGLVAGYLALALAPLAVAAVTAPAGSGFSRELGSGLAIVAYAMMLVQFVLIGRFRPISGRVGIDAILRLHQLLARLLTVFLLLHPFIYALPRLASDPAAYGASVVTMFSAPAFASGIVALALLLVLMLLGLRRTRLPFSYEAWRASHGALAAVIAIAGLHHAFTVGELSAHPALRGLWLLLAVLALATLLHGYLVRPLLQLRRPWRVAEVRRLGPARWHLALEPEGEPLAFSAGQFVWLKVGRLPFTLRENPFSVICAPGARRIEFLIREAGDFTGSVGSLRPGDRAWVDGPHGAFTLHAAAGAKRIVMLAGGVGLAPILSMLRAAADAGDRRAFHLVFANRTREQVVPLAAIDDLGARLDLKTDLVLSEPPADWTGVRGQMDARTLLPLLAAGAGADTIYYLCGPPPMVRASLAALVALGVSPRRIVTERFDYE